MAGLMREANVRQSVRGIAGLVLRGAKCLDHRAAPERRSSPKDGAVGGRRRESMNRNYETLTGSARPRATPLRHYAKRNHRDLY